MIILFSPILSHLSIVNRQYLGRYVYHIYYLRYLYITSINKKNFDAITFVFDDLLLTFKIFLYLCPVKVNQKYMLKYV